jgi:hypothetical protein
MSGPDKSREAFEAWCETCDERSSWHAWQASRAAALEEAAKVCDEHAARKWPTDKHEWAAIGDCADDIRAIARKEKE